jgi:hypothetical protein
VVKKSHSPTPINTTSPEQQNWQSMIAVVVISFEVICITLSVTNKIMLFIGVGGAIGFALLFFNRQFREKYLGYQGDSRNFVASPTKFKNTQMQVEQSLLLWALVVLLAITAFISLDLATHSFFSLLAIPFGVAGSLWSYRRRQLTKHLLTHFVFTLAVFLVLSCLGGAFWGQTIEKAKHFLGSERDLVLPLAMSFLLVAIQLVRMWSLCYKRGLASSVLISTMLMVSTILIGDNLGFLLLLALFVILLLPTLMLFYRSTLHLKPIGLSIVPRPQQLTERHVPWKYLTKIAVFAVTLGCLLSLFTPHFKMPEVSWNVPGLNELVNSLPIQQDPTLSYAETNSDASQKNSGQNEAGESSSGVDQAGTSTGAPNPDQGKSGVAASLGVNRRNSEFMDEQLARQAIQNILATADRTLKTKAERRAYLDKYLKDHIKSASCDATNANCFPAAAVRHDQFRDETSLALWNQSTQLALKPYYVAQARSVNSLLRQLTIPCPVNQQDCYKNRVFHADQQESIRTRNRLLRSVGGIDLSQNNLDRSVVNGSAGGSSGGQGGISGNGSAGNSDNQSGIPGNGSAGNSDNQSGIPGNGSAGNSDNQSGIPGNESAGSSGNQGGISGNGASEGNSGSQSTRNSEDIAAGQSGISSPLNREQKVDSDDNRSTKNNKKAIDRRAAQNKNRPQPQPKNLTQQLEPSPAPTPSIKTSSINSEQLMNFLRIVVIILLMVAGVIWYLRLQGRQEKIVKQKELKFNQLPTIERIYWLMLKELKISGSIKKSYETEWEFALSKTQQAAARELQYPGLLGKLITEISGDYVAWRYGKQTPNESSLNQKFERFKELHREFHGAELAKRKETSGIILPAKKTFHPVK